jgi:hypothetical protein
MQRLEIVAAQCRADERAVIAHQRRHLAQRVVAENVAVRRPDIAQHQFNGLGEPDLMGKHQHLAHERPGGE